MTGHVQSLADLPAATPVETKPKLVANSDGRKIYHVEFTFRSDSFYRHNPPHVVITYKKCYRKLDYLILCN